MGFSILVIARLKETSAVLQQGDFSVIRGERRGLFNVRKTSFVGILGVDYAVIGMFSSVGLRMRRYVSRTGSPR
jgi:hypothetical protein